MYRRVLAQCVDIAATALIARLIISIPVPSGIPEAILAILAVAGALGYRLLGDAMFAGSGFGKTLFRIRVVDAATRKPCSFGQSAIRMGIFHIPFAPFIEFDLLYSHGERWGDRLAKTYVLLCNPPPPPIPVPMRPSDFAAIRESLQRQREQK
jgi:uncharacterized RDD family membrane protein YckC